MIDLIQKRLAEYKTQNPVEEEQATKEIIQEIALFALWRAGFFEVAAFQGGTSLRILHGLPRFSEDLDFILKQPNAGFDWAVYLEKLLASFEEFGLQSEALARGGMDGAIRKAVIKDNSVVNQLDLSFFKAPASQKLHIKLEIDVDPPAGSGFGYTFIDFPVDFDICHQDLSSNFSLKIHALLCRPYLKGRDWFDFDWYVKQGVQANLPLLQNALQQYGPWKGEDDLCVDRNWLARALNEKVHSIEWSEARKDVERFLKPDYLAGLRRWNAEFFAGRIKTLTEV